MNKKEKHFSSTLTSGSIRHPNDIILSNTDQVYLLVDTDYTIVASNASSNQLVRQFLTFDIEAGMSVFDLVPPKKRNTLRKIYDKVFTGERHSIEKKYMISGQAYYFRIRYRPAYDQEGIIVGAIVTADDITETKTKELELQLSEERWRFAIEGSNQGLWDWNIATGEIYFSASWKKLFGFTEEDIITNVEHWQQRIHPQDRKIVKDHIKKHFASENPNFENLYRFRAKNGDYRWLLSRGVIIEKNSQGKPLRMIGTHTDITQLRLLEENYKILFDANPLPAWTYCLQSGHFIEVNRAALHLYGYTKKEFQTMSVTQLIAETQEEQKGSPFLLQNGQYQQHRKKNGDIITVKLTSHTLEMEKGNVALVMAENVTKRVAAEQALFLSNERFRLASMATSDAIYDWDMVKGELNWGDGLYPLFGYQSHEVTLKNWETYVHPDEQDDVLESLFNTIKDPGKKNGEKEYRFKSAKGHYRYVIEMGFIIRDNQGKALRMIGALQDITAIKQKQLELEKSNERFDAVVQATNDFIWDWNLEDNTFYFDEKGLKKVLGIEKPNKMRNVILWVKRLHPDDQAEAYEMTRKILAGEITQTFERQYRFRKDDGTYAYISDRGIVLCNKEGKPVRLIGASEDVTVRKKLEQELLQKELEKQKIISKATIDAQEQERGEIGRELHDNVNQVLTTTKLYLELAALKPELKEEMIRKSSENIILVINEIRQLSRSLMNPSIGDLGLMDAVNDLIDDINATKKLSVKLQASPGVDELLTPDLKLMVYRILQEALNNAIRHSKATQVMISIKKKEKNIELVVQDNGVGFEIALVNKGIGLKNIENRVYLANGRVQLNSSPGSGFTLSIQFPYKKN